MKKCLIIYLILLIPIIIFGQITEIKNLSAPRGNISTAIFGDTILFVGGSSSRIVDYFNASNFQLMSAEYGSDGFSRANVVQNERFAVFYNLQGVNLLLRSMYVYDNITQQWYSDKYPVSEWQSFDNGYFDNNIVIFFDTDDKEKLYTYNLETKEWGTRPTPFSRREVTIIDTGEKIFFIGGRENFNTRSDSVHVFNKVNSIWESFILSEAKNGVTAIQFENKVIIAGGQLSNINADKSVDLVEVIDIENYSLMTIRLSEKKNNLKGVIVKNNVIFAGGNSKKAEVINMDDFSLTTFDFNVTHDLRFLNGGNVGTKAFFAGGNDQDGNQIFVYNSNADDWSNFMIDEARRNMAFVSIGNRLFAAGGEISQGNKKFDEIFIFEDITTSNIELEKDEIFIETFPNPVSNILYLNETSRKIKQISILNMYGNTLKNVVDSTREIDVSFLPPGTYLLTIYVNDSIVNKLFVKN